MGPVAVQAENWSSDKVYVDTTPHSHTPRTDLPDINAYLWGQLATYGTSQLEGYIYNLGYSKCYLVLARNYTMSPGSSGGMFYEVDLQTGSHAVTCRTHPSHAAIWDASSYYRVIAAEPIK